MTGRRCRFMPITGVTQRVCWAGAALIAAFLLFWFAGVK